MPSKTQSLSIREGAIIEMRQSEEITVLVDKMKLRCECEFQWETSKKSRDLIASELWPQPIRDTNLDRILIGH